MKKFIKILGLFALFVLLIILILNSAKTKLKSDLQKPGVEAVTPSVSEFEDLSTSGKTNRSIFVPYWTLDRVPIGDEYTEAIYFGITPTATGINTTESGYAGLKNFAEQAGNRQTLLALRMLDNTSNFKIIESKGNRTKVIQATLIEAKNSGFDGILLDLEVSVIPFDSVTKNISTFIEEFGNEAKKQNLKFKVAIYGDTYYRLRPFDVKSIAKSSDSIMIMAYDFHKSRGNPGPNFPLKGKEKYGYDFESMIDGFSKDVPREKITVIFGMFGYDWTVDENGKSKESAEALSYFEISEKFLKNCTEKDCTVTRDTLSAEPMITYTDSENEKHVVWFEDAESVKKKEEFLKKNGINNTSFWSHSYF